MKHVSSTDLQRNLSEYRRQALMHPVIIEDRGKPSTAMISYELFTELMALKAEAYGNVDFQPIEYNILGKAVLANLNRVRPGEGGKNGWITKTYANVERLFSLTPINDNSFEAGGYIFDLKDKTKPAISVSPWILGKSDNNDMEEFRAQWGSRLTTRLFLETQSQERPWEGAPSKDLLNVLMFIPAVMGLMGEKDQVAEWIAKVTTGHVFWDMDDRPIERGLMKVAPLLIARNEQLLQNHYPSFDRDAFVAVFEG
jgi:hypothetical protein